MTPASDLPLLIVAPTVLLVLAGAGLAATGCLGLLRFSSFYHDRDDTYQPRAPCSRIRIPRSQRT
jgi:hypothetical protein